MVMRGAGVEGESVTVQEGGRGREVRKAVYVMGEVTSQPPSGSRAMSCCCRRPERAKGSLEGRNARRTRRSGEAGRTDGHHERVRMRRRAGDDVSIYTSKKQESTEYEEMRKGKKRRRRNAPIIRSQAYNVKLGLRSASPFDSGRRWMAEWTT
jgi:hypothetical protein